MANVRRAANRRRMSLGQRAQPDYRRDSCLRLEGIVPLTIDGRLETLAPRHDLRELELRANSFRAVPRWGTIE
jgi:hypothetical protein